MDLQKTKEFLKAISNNLMMLVLLALTFSILVLAIALAGFTVELAATRKSIPATLNRIDRQITEVNKIVNSAEAAGKVFSSDMSSDISNSVSGGINEGIASGIVNLPVNTVKNVGGQLTNTALDTGKHTINIWQGIKERLMFWQKKSSPTQEALPAKQK